MLHAPCVLHPDAWSRCDTDLHHCYGALELVKYLSISAHSANRLRQAPCGDLVIYVILALLRRCDRQHASKSQRLVRPRSMTTNNLPSHIPVSVYLDSRDYSVLSDSKRSAKEPELAESLERLKAIVQ